MWVESALWFCCTVTRTTPLMACTSYGLHASTHCVFKFAATCFIPLLLIIVDGACRCLERKVIGKPDSKFSHMQLVIEHSHQTALKRCSSQPASVCLCLVTPCMRTLLVCASLHSWSSHSAHLDVHSSQIQTTQLVTGIAGGFVIAMI